MPEPRWRTSSRCGGSTTCVQAGAAGPVVLLRDSADPAAGVLALTGAAFANLLTTIKETPDA